MGEAGLDASDASESLTGREVMQRYLVDHIAEHAAQIEEARAALGR